jgi:hypothetical protein
MEKSKVLELIGGFDLHISQRILWLSDFFKIDELVEFSIEKLIIPQISPSTVLIFLKDVHKKISAT